MLLAQYTRAFDNDSTLVVQRTFANDPYLRDVERLRAAGVGQTGHSRLAGRIPMHILSQWLKDAGVKWDDNQGVKDVIRRNLLSGEFDKFRVWEGTF